VRDILGVSTDRWELHRLTLPLAAPAQPEIPLDTGDIDFDAWEMR
jgi:hypothetical protein